MSRSILKKAWKGWPKSLKDSNIFMEYSNNNKDIYKSITGYNQEKKEKVLIVIDDMIRNFFQ